MSTGIWATNYNPPDFAQKSFGLNITRYMPNGMTSLLALTSLFQSETAKQIEHGFWVESMIFPELELTANVSASDTVFPVTSTEHILPNTMFQTTGVIATARENVIVDAVLSPTSVRVSRGVGSVAPAAINSGVKMVHVPYKGDAPAVADLLAGHVNVMFGNVAQASAHLRSGKLKVLAVTSAKRLSSMPNIPAMQEVVPGVVAVAWFAMVAPPKRPAAIVNRLSSLIGEILRTPEMTRRFAEVGAEPVGNTPEEMAQWMKEDTERWRQVIKTGGVTID